MSDIVPDLYTKEMAGKKKRRLSGLEKSLRLSRQEFVRQHCRAEDAKVKDDGDDGSAYAIWTAGLRLLE